MTAYYWSNSPFEMKSFGHKSHWKGRSAFTPLLWLRWWNNRFPFSGKDLPHSSHAYGLSPVWQRLKYNWLILFEIIRNKIRNRNGNEHETNLMWLIKCSFRVNGLLHTVHTCGLSPEWCFKWLDKCSFLVNVLLQNSHLCGEIPAEKL